MTGKGDQEADNDLFLVDCGVESLTNVYLNLPNLRSLNLHSNYITRIENLTGLSSLTFLDLSSNQILRIEGIKYLSNLKHLNLSSNLITIVEGLTTLSSLVSLNLSYNQIVNISGLRRLPAGNNLSCVQLQGNKLTDLNHVITCVRGCRHLSCLVLHDGPSATNPLCVNLAYEVVLKQQLTHLQSTAKPPPDSDDSFIREARQAVVETDSRTSVISTPRIDAVLTRFHKALENKQVSPPSTADSTPRVSESLHSGCTEQSSTQSTAHDEEKKALELQLEQLQKELLKKKIESTELQLRDLNESSPVKTSEPEKPSDAEPFKHGDKQAVRRQINSNNNASKTGPQARPTRQGSAATRKFANTRSTDIMYRDAVNSTYQQLMKDLDMERMRRCKAEEAARHLAQQVKAVETSTSEQQLAQRNCDDMIKSLKRELNECRESQQQRLDQSERLQVEYKEMGSELRRCRKTCKSQEVTIRKLEEVQERLEQLRVETENKHREKSEKDHRELSDSVELLRAAQATVNGQRKELEDLKSLLAARESDHKRDMEHRYTLDSPKLEELFQSKITSLVRENAAECNEYEQRISNSTKEYSELEDEFRMALQIEANRFQALKRAFEKLSSDQSSQEQTLRSCQVKDARATKMIGDLTQLMKEQKDKIISLSKEKQEVNQRMQGTKSRLEQQIENLNNKVKDQEKLKKDNLELKNQVQGQHSIISGLRKERELWSKELVQQGASLSNERGTLEAKIETLTQENKTLRANLDTEIDTVKIKTKLVSDLTDSVSKLKQKLGQEESEGKDKGRQLQCIKEDHERELAEERSRCSELEQEVDGLVTRKEELKEQLRVAEDELSQVKESHRALKSKWQEKSSSISTLESQVKEMKDGWINKEKNLTEERDKAIQAADLALQHLRSADDGFRKQLGTKELSHEQRVHELTSQYELRIAEEQHRVEQVEQEMRELLQDKENSKVNFDNRLKRLSQALAELQNDGS